MSANPVQTPKSIETPKSVEPAKKKAAKSAPKKAAPAPKPVPAPKPAPAEKKAAPAKKDAAEKKSAPKKKASADRPPDLKEISPAAEKMLTLVRETLKLARSGPHSESCDTRYTLPKELPVEGLRKSSGTKSGLLWKVDLGPCSGCKKPRIVPIAYWAPSLQWLRLCEVRAWLICRALDNCKLEKKRGTKCEHGFPNWTDALQGKL